jgi:hypothetical protein
MPKGVRLKPEQIVAKLREIEVKMGQGKDVLTACREAGASAHQSVACAQTYFRIVSRMNRMVE